MAISLTKGQKIDLTKTNAGLNNILVGLGWDTNRYDGEFSFDLDASAFMLKADGKCTGEDGFIYYNHTEDAAKSVHHTGDNLTGEGDGDDEQLLVALNKVPQEVERVAFTVTIYDAIKRNQNFGQVENSFIRLVNQDTNEELIRYDLNEDFSIETAIVVGELYRNNGEWKFSAIGSGFQGGLEALVKNYGLQL